MWVFLFLVITLMIAPLYAAAGSSCAGLPMGTHVPHESNCGLFYFCDGYGNKVEESCIDGYYFDAGYRYCRPSGQVMCETGAVATAPTTKSSTAAPRLTPTTASKVTSTSAPTAPSSAGFSGYECKYIGSDGDLLSYPGDCTRFIHCAHQIAWVKNCPAPLHFNRVERVCDWPEQAGCQSLRFLRYH